jgi:hypothetical protein
MMGSGTLRCQDNRMTGRLENDLAPVELVGYSHEVSLALRLTFWSSFDAHQVRDAD